MRLRFFFYVRPFSLGGNTYQKRKLSHVPTVTLSSVV